MTASAAERFSRPVQRLALLRIAPISESKISKLKRLVPHDAVDPVGFVFHHGRAALGF
jgi:hypothetical protein